MPDETWVWKVRARRGEVSKHLGFSRPSSEMSCLKDAGVHEGMADFQILLHVSSFLGKSLGREPLFSIALGTLISIALVYFKEAIEKQTKCLTRHYKREKTG